MDNDGLRPQDYLAILWRRKWLIILPFLVLFSASFALALLLPREYRSSATILIEEADVPSELVTSTITGFADQRLQVISQRVMATQNLLEIIRKYDLYPEARRVRPVSEVVEAMRQKIKMDLVSAEVRDPQSGRAGEATIAFTVAFDHGSPQTAQRVANEIVSLYLSENMRERQEKATETATFLAAETRRLETSIAQLENQIADLKVQNAGSLPEQRDYNLQSIARSEQELRDLDRRAQTLNERTVYLQTEMMQTSPYGSYVVDGQQVLRPADQLKALRVQLAALAGRYGPNHPDVVRARREVEALEKETGTGPDPASLQRQLQQVETERAKARERYTRTHPEVIRLGREADGIRAALARAQVRPQAATTAEAPDNPAYLQMQAELAAAQSEIKAVVNQQNAVRQRIAVFEQLIERTPLVERAYLPLIRALEAANGEYRDLRARQTAAELGQSLEAERKSERFSLLEPPLLPTEAVRPNRTAIVMLGFVLSLGAGIALALLAEALDSAVHSARQLVKVTGAAPIAVIPYIRTRLDVIRAWRARAAVGAGAMAVAGLAMFAVHTYVMPLDLLWSAVERKVETRFLTPGI